jgi:membrane protease subunit (stomatin/prohibitin family)
MGILKRQLRSVIQWTNPDPGALFQRWSDNGDEIKNASRLIVGPGQGCLMVYEGRVVAVHEEQGMYTVASGNVPFLTTLSRLMQAFVSEHKVGIYYFKTTRLLNLKWGTPSSVKYEDPVYKFPVALRAFGNYAARIRDPGAFFAEVVGGRDVFPLDDLRQPLNARLVQPLADYLAESQLSYAQIDTQREEIATALAAKLAPEVARLGFVLEDFRIEGTSFDEDTMRRINRIADVGAEAHAARSAGLSYAELQRLEALRDAARNDGGGAGLGMGMAVGLGAAANVGAGAGAGAGAGPDDSATKLQRLKDLFDKGLISQADYDAKRAEILTRF